MTPLPKRKLSTRRQGDRRSHFLLKKGSLTLCPNCKKPALAHRVCRFCGYYNGRLVKKPAAQKNEKSA